MARKYARSAKEIWERKDPAQASKLLQENFIELRKLDTSDSRIAIEWLALCVERYGTNNQFDLILEALDTHSQYFWPASSIIGNYLYKKGNIEEAYAIFSRTEFGDLRADRIPTWSMGVSAYVSMFRELKPDAAPRIHTIQNRIDRKEHRAIVCIGVDDQYLPFALNMHNSITDNDIHVSILVHTENSNQLLSSMSLKNENISIFTERKDISDFSIRNRKGYFTLLRYRLANFIRNITDCPIIIPDADAIFSRSTNFTNILEVEADVGLLMVRHWPRPWLRFTAPFTFINNTHGATSFLKMVNAISESAIQTVSDRKNISLWGVDQAALQIAYDEEERKGVKFFNVIPFVSKNMKQAQEFQEKSFVLLAKNDF